MKKLLFLIPFLLLAGCGTTETKVLTAEESSVECANIIYNAITKTDKGKNVKKSDLTFKVITKDCDEAWCIILWNVTDWISDEIYGCAIVWDKIIQYQTDLYWVWTWNNWVQIEEADTEEIEVEQKPKVWIEKQNALSKAESYLKSSDFSKKELKEQLEFEWFTADAVSYAMDNINADWKKECLWKAKSYLKSSNFSKQGLREQLEFEWFLKEEIDYAINQINW